MHENAPSNLPPATAADHAAGGTGHAAPLTGRWSGGGWEGLLPVVLLAVALAAFGAAAPRFLTPASLMNLLADSASVAIVAVGMTVVLLTGGIDLSVGSIMFLAAALAGQLVLTDDPLPAVLAAALILPLGLAFGAVNGWLVARVGLLPFVVTLATLYIGRGAGRWITQTRAMNLPGDFLMIGQAQLLGVPFPVVLLVLVAAAGHVLLTHTPFGRQVYAVGFDAEAARKAGVRVGRVRFAVYLISGLCAAAGGVVSVARLGSVSPTFGQRVEFDAIAAAVVGGTSLFGGRGRVFPGTVFGAILIQTVFNGLLAVGANRYVYPVVTGGIIFLAVLIDRLRQAAAERAPRPRRR